MPKPDETVAARIAEDLSKNGFVSREKVSPLVARLAEGRISAEDWVRLAEQKQERETKHGNAN